MDVDKKKKLRSLKVIISEAIMVLAVIITVAVLAFIVSGYWINSDFEVERQGMLQISSVPTGATVNIDGEDSSWLQRTNTSKVLTSGEHTITLTKEDYDSWNKTVDIKEGLLYRLHYPRLFLKDRTPEKIMSLSGTTAATISSDREAMVLMNNTTKWSYLKLNAEEPESKPLDIAKYFSGVSLADSAPTGLFTSEIIDVNWDFDDAHILFEVKTGDSIEWVLIDVNNPEKSINLTKEFGFNFNKIEIIDNSASTLLAIQNGNLHKIDVPSRQISASLVKDVISFDHFKNEIVFTAKNTEAYYVGFFKIGDSKPIELTTLEQPARILISKFYDEKYITILQDTKLSVYKKDDFVEYSSFDLSFAPEEMEVGHDGEFITMNTGSRIATLDMEAGLIREWNADGEHFDWIDNDMIYAVNNGELIVYDFDGFNRRALSKNVSSHFPAGITDNKWLYYVSDDDLMRELITR